MPVYDNGTYFLLKFQDRPLSCQFCHGHEHAFGADDDVAPGDDETVASTSRGLDCRLRANRASVGMCPLMARKPLLFVSE